MTEETIFERFQRRLDDEPDSPLFTFVDEAGRDQETLSVRDTARHAESIAGFLRSRGDPQPGDRVLLVYPPSLDFVKAFVGCLFARIIPVPLPPPNPMSLASDLDRFAALAASSGARSVLTNAEYTVAKTLGSVRNVLKRPWRKWPDLTWRTTDRVKPGSYEAPPFRAPSAGETAFLQYTSGSTSQPKGVMITFGNLEHQLSENARDLGLGPRSRMVAWVPHFHDFGLISGILSALHGNGRLFMMSPLHFIQRPHLWFDVMSRVRATHTAAPTFAYELAVRKTTPAQRQRWDLRSLEVAMCAAEPIHHDTARRFIEAFAPAGFSEKAFCPAYGLAEHTVGVSVGGRGVLRVDRRAIEREGRVELVTMGTPLYPPARKVDAQATADSKVLVGCGAPSGGVRVRVVDPDSGSPCPEGRVGEIWVDSPSKAAGYYGLPEETQRTFRAKVPGDETEYLRTGDLGFVHASEIYITGRSKEVIIIRGRNLYPQDIEEGIRDCHPLVRPGGVAAFSVEERGPNGAEEERLVVLVEVRDQKLGPAKARDVVSAIRREVLARNQQACRTVVLGPPGAVLKTTSGKVMRGACKQAFLSGDLLRNAVHVDHAIDAPEPEPATPPAAAEPPPPPPRQVGDPRLRDLDPDYRRLIAELGSTFRRLGAARGGRVFHKAATTLRGEFRVRGDLRIPRHRFFAAGATFPVILRHANGIQDDDAACDNRGATLRVLAPGAEPDLGAPLLDLLLTTGRCFLAASAEEFRHWMTAGEAARAAIAREKPHIAAAAWEMFRSPRSYAELCYYSKIASRFLDEDGGRWFVRYRLVPAEGAADTGFVEAGGRILPPEMIPRRPGDARSKTFLHEELRARLASGGVHYVLELQLRSESAGPADENEDALDCTRPWPEDRHPWRPVARISLTACADEAAVDRLRFDPWNAPPELGLPLARSAGERASLGHVRSLVYEVAARARLGEPLPADLAALFAGGEEKPKVPARRVCVVGAGASGLAAAWALERLGHRVTVLERGPEVAGKCASIEVDGRAYDWGGHLCTGHYTALATMVGALGVEKVPATPTIVWDLETASVRPREDGARIRQEFLKYQGIRGERFARIVGPRLSPVAKALAAPAHRWFAGEGLAALGAAIGINYTSCGYGYLDDEALAALYVVKAAEMGGILSTGKGSGLPESWTVRGGFGAFFRRVAASLGDVRCGVAPAAIERRDGRVFVRTEAATLEFDDVIIASPLDDALSFLDADADEEDLFGRIRYVDYYTMVCRATGLPRSGFYLLKQHCESARFAGHAVAFHHRYEDSDVVLFYGYGAPHLDRSAIEDRIRADVARMGGRLTEVIDHRRWKYFPHAQSRDIEAGYYDRVEALQGRRNTYYLGGLFNFELIECNVAHAHDLVSRFFAGDEARAPERREDAGFVSDLRARLDVTASPTVRFKILVRYLQELFAEELRLGAPPSPEIRFTDLGLDSVKAVEIFHRLAGDTGAGALAPVIFFDHPTIEALATFLSNELAAEASGSPAPRRASPARRRQARSFTQIEDVVIAGSHGVAVTMDIFVPTSEPNGLAVVDVATANWRSDRDVILQHQINGTYDAFSGRGFTVFAVRPGSYTRFGVEDMVGHVRDAIRWVKANAASFCVDPDRIGLAGGSSGGHLACLAALSRERDSRAGALALYYPTMRFHVEAGNATHQAIARGLARLGDDASMEACEARLAAWTVSQHVGPHAPPAIVYHARHDRVAPFEGSADLVTALREAGCSAELVPRESDGHPWPGIERDLITAAEWMERTLRARADEGAPRVEDPLSWFVTSWRASPHALRGSFHLFDLAWLGRVAAPDDPSRPAFPEAIAALRALQRPDGGLGAPSPHPYCGFVTSIAFANTLLRWSEGGDEAVARAIEHAFREDARAQHPLYTGAGDRLHRFHGFFGRWLVPARELGWLLDRGDRYLSADQRRIASSYASAKDAGAGDHASHFENDSLVLHFAEYFPDSAFTSAAARDHAARVRTMPGLTAAAAARYYEVTRDPGTFEILRALLDRPLDGLRPGGRLQELQFALHYLVGAGADVRRHFAKEIAEIQASLGPMGAGVEPGARIADCDASAVTQRLCHALDIPTQMATSTLETFWDEGRSSYQSADGHGTYTVSTTMHVLDAYLHAPDVGHAERLAVWRRVTKLLEARPWVELHHLSPFYIWEKIVSILGAHERHFPEAPTRAHHDALSAIVARQAPGGGFHSAHVGEPNVEETAFALLALKSALGWPLSPPHHAELAAAATRAQAFLTRAWPGPQRAETLPDLWVGKLTYAPVNVVDAIVVAALTKPFPTPS